MNIAEIIAKARALDQERASIDAQAKALNLRRNELPGELRALAEEAASAFKDAPPALVEAICGALGRDAS